MRQPDTTVCKFLHTIWSRLGKFSVNAIGNKKSYVSYIFKYFYANKITQEFLLWEKVFTSSTSNKTVLTFFDSFPFHCKIVLKKDEIIFLCELFVYIYYIHDTFFYVYYNY